MSTGKLVFESHHSNTLLVSLAKQQLFYFICPQGVPLEGFFFGNVISSKLICYWIYVYLCLV